MWATEEKAIIDFISVIFRQIIPTSIEPINEMQIRVLLLINLLINKFRRTIPRPPNFNKIPAKIIDPKTGASTCAKGSHKCIPYMGSLTKNPKAKLILKIILLGL